MHKRTILGRGERKRGTVKKDRRDERDLNSTWRTDDSPGGK